jgi:hypothetical protein
MLQITLPQMRRLAADWDARCADRLSASLHKHLGFRFADRTAAQRRDFALACIRQARTRGLVKEGDLTRYANIAAFLGIGFEAHPAAVDAGLLPLADEGFGPVWLHRIGARVEQLLREREQR